MRGRDLKIIGLVLRKTDFRETSLILDVLTEELGKIAVIAKGVKSAKSDLQGSLEFLNEVELDLYSKPQSDWYQVRSANIIKSHLYEIDFKQSLLMQAAAEIIRQLQIPHEDQESIFLLTSNYLNYIPKVKENGIAIFWRFLLRLNKILGIELNLHNCVICKKKKHNFSAFSIQFHGLICSDCFRPSFAIAWSHPEEISHIFHNISQIGNLLGELKISELTIKHINKLFLDHYEEHFNKSFHLKSLEIYK